jgi:trimeric autotransporter adhesin
MKKYAYLFFIFHLSFLTLFAQNGTITTLAGSTAAGYNGDGIQAIDAQLNQDGGIAVDDSGNIYIADSQNNRIRKVYKSSGLIATLAGTGEEGYSGDSGKATEAQCSFPICVRLDSLHNIYFSDAGNACIRKITAAGIIYTIAGTDSENYLGDGGKATEAMLNYPAGIALDKNLNIYIADQNNNVIRKVTTSTSIITTIAGNHIAGYSGDGDNARDAELNNPTGVAVDRSGKIYIADFKNNVIRMINTKGVISTFAGTGEAGYNKDKGPAKTIELNNPACVSTDNSGNVYIADAGNNMVREVLITTNQMILVAGDTASGYQGDGGIAVKAELNYPFDIALDKKGNLFIADLANNRVRKVTASAPKRASGYQYHTYGSEFTPH